MTRHPHSVAALALLVCCGALPTITADPEDPQPFPVDTVIEDTLPEITSVRNYHLTIDTNLSQDDVLFSFEWASGLPWFLLKCAAKPSIFPFDATWFVRPERGATTASLELPNHQCYNDSSLWLKVYAFNPTIDFKISYTLLGTRTTSLATGYRPLGPLASPDFFSMEYSTAHVYKIAVPPAFRESIVAKFDIYGNQHNPTSDCDLTMSIYVQQGSNLQRHGNVQNRCSSLGEGRSVFNMARPVQLASDVDFVFLVVEASDGIRTRGSPRLVATPDAYNLAQTAFTVSKRSRDTVPSTFSVSYLRTSRHPGLAVSFDFAQPRVLDVVATPVHVISGNIGALSWHYFTIKVRAPGMLALSYSAEEDEDMVAVMTYEHSVPSESRRSTTIPHVGDAATERPKYFWFHGTKEFDAVVGVRGNSKVFYARPYQLTVVAHPAAPVVAFERVEGSVGPFQWRFFSARLRRVARVQVPIRTDVEGVQLFMGPGQYPTTDSVQAKPTDTPGVMCAEMELTGDGMFYIGVTGVGIAQGAAGTGGAAADFEIQLVLNGFGACEFYD